MCDCTKFVYVVTEKASSVESYLYLERTGTWTRCLDQRHAFVALGDSIRPIARKFFSDNERRQNLEDISAVCVDCGLSWWSWLYS